MKPGVQASRPQRMSGNSFLSGREGTAPVSYDIDGN